MNQAFFEMAPPAKGGPVWKPRPRLAKFVDWWSVPRLFGLFALVLGLMRYFPLPYLPVVPLINLHAGIAPELIGIGVTFVLLDWAAERRDSAQRKAQLIRQLGSRYREVTEIARIELENSGALVDGSLRKVRLVEANLAEAFLQGANLSGSNLTGANISKAHLSWAKLTEVKFWKANLEEVSAYAADLTNASFWQANLRHADLSWSVLSGANLAEADLNKSRLLGADLRQATQWSISQLEQAIEFAGAIMPDGVQLQGMTWSGVFVTGPTFSEWKMKFLEKNGGTVTDVRHRLQVDMLRIGPNDSPGN